MRTKLFEHGDTTYNKDCPDTAALNDFAAGLTSAEAHSEILLHLSICDDCQELAGKAYLFANEMNATRVSEADARDKAQKTCERTPIDFGEKTKEKAPFSVSARASAFFSSAIFKAAASVIFLAGGLIFYNPSFSWLGHDPLGFRGVNPTDGSGGKPIPQTNESHALIIGQSYEDNANWRNLPGVRADTPEIATVLDEAGFQVQLAENLGKEEMEQGIRRFIEKRGRNTNNRLLIYFAGHGHTLNSLNNGPSKGYLAASDTAAPSDRGEFIKTALDMEKIGLLAQMNGEVGQILFVFDACFSGTVFYNANESNSPRKTHGGSLPVRQFITAGSANETVPDQSIFKEYFIKGIRGAADYPVGGIRDGNISAAELGFYLWKELKDLETAGFRQTPQFGTLEKIWGATEYVVKYAALNPVKGEEIPPGDKLEWEDWFKSSNAGDYASIAAHLEKYPEGRFYASAYRKLANLYAEKKIPKESHQSLVPILKEGVEINDPHSMYILGAMYHRNEITEKNEEYFKELLAKSEQEGTPHALALAGEVKLNDAIKTLKKASVMGFNSENSMTDLNRIIQTNREKEQKIKNFESLVSELKSELEELQRDSAKFVSRKIDQNPDVLRIVNQKLFNEYATLMLAVRHQTDLNNKQKYVLSFRRNDGRITKADFYPKSNSQEELLYAVTSVPKGDYVLESVQSSSGTNTEIPGGVAFPASPKDEKELANLTVLGKSSLVIRNTAQGFSAISTSAR